MKETLSIHEADDLDQSIHGINVAKAENKKILYNVNIIQQALAAGVQISFDNLAWNSRKKLEKNHLLSLDPLRITSEFSK